MELSLLMARDTFELARLLHNRFRNSPGGGSRDQVLKYMQILIKDLKQRKIQPHPMASLHILSYCKASKQFDIGVDFWEWILLQDRGFMDARTYGAGIELLAYYGKPLHHLESLYIEALRRYPGAFSEYHLSPQAIVTDPSRPSNAPGSRLVLLQGILTARALHGDWRNAYLALDTALRLYPDQVPSRFFELFIFERPVRESFHIFQVACRSGCPVTPATFTHLLSKLTELQQRSPHVLDRIRILKRMLTSLQAYFSAGGKTNVRHLNKIIEAVLQATPSPAGVNACEPQYKRLSSAMEPLIVAFFELGVPASPGTFNVIISMGGKLGRPDLVAGALRSLSEAGLEPDLVTHYCLLGAAGRLGDAEGIKAAWHSIVESEAGPNPTPGSGLVGRKISPAAWKALVNAGKRSGNMAFVKEQLTKYQVKLPEHAVPEEEGFQQTKVGVDPAEEKDVSHETKQDILKALPMDQLPTIERAADGIFDKLKEIQDLATAPKANFYDSPLPMTIFPEPLPFDEVADSEYRGFYKALSTDIKSKMANGKETAVTQMSTGFTLAELRYQNWKAINQLLVESERHEAENANKIDRAPKDGKSLPQTKQGNGKHWTRDAETDGHSEVPAWVALIMRLRGFDMDTSFALVGRYPKRDSA
ncbi:hypothetical protein FGG08_005420 [Glutinoglossum americanum]|uniref:Pentatricopeptide repeat-containing protein n=1 Tax=Glutinoglossum americanum TaxID=1670608 RepID=A0A9P8L2W7_9PEZI|nr:hypothetical protein FGG08_005420 [Glutinoglossum americanum]